jgi:CRP/FNR family transcriptional regulator
MQILTASIEEKTAFLRQCRYLSGLADHLLNSLSGGTWLRRYAPGEIVCWQDEPCEGLFVIRKGSVKLFKISGKGRELILRIFEEGNTFNEVPVFDGGLNVVNVAALEESEVWVVDRNLIRRMMNENPRMSEAVILNLSQNLRMMVTMIEELSFYQVTNRLARLINQLPSEQLEGSPAQRITQDQLAARLGTVREVVARSLRDLERSGAIRMERRQIQVVDKKVLKEWGQEPFN